MEKNQEQQDEETRSHSSNLPIVAHQGLLELLDAKWELHTGRTAKFRLVDDPRHPFIVHPFTQFVRRRGGRAGTRFRVAFVRYGASEPFYNGEVMLMSGGNPLGQGMWVSFWLDDDTSEHPFCGCTGRTRTTPGDMFAAVFVELDDDDEPINQEKRARIEKIQDGRGGNLARFAAQLCLNENFLQYLSEKVPVGDPPEQRSKEWWGADEHAARWVRWICKVESRADLDHNPQAAEIFHTQVREPFRDWNRHSED